MPSPQLAYTVYTTAQPQSHGEPCVGTRTQWAPAAHCLRQSMLLGTLPIQIMASKRASFLESIFPRCSTSVLDTPFSKYHVLVPSGVWKLSLLQYSEAHVVVTLHYRQEIGLLCRTGGDRAGILLAQRAWRHGRVHNCLALEL